MMVLFKKLWTEFSKRAGWQRHPRREEVIEWQPHPLSSAETHTAHPLLERILKDAYDAGYGEEILSPLACGLVCSKDGRRHCRELFPDALWLDHYDTGLLYPGGNLAHATGFGLEALKERHVHVVMLENHGIAIAGRSMDDVCRQRRITIERLRLAYRKAVVPLALNITHEPGSPGTERILRGLFGSHAAHLVSSGLFAYAPRAVTRRGAIISGDAPFSVPLDAKNIGDYAHQHGEAPNVVVAGDRVYGLGSTEQKARAALDAAMESALIMQLADAFGGVRFLNDHPRRLSQDAA